MYDEATFPRSPRSSICFFVSRQCALTHIEQVWADNQFTAEGNVLHERTHEGPDESRPGVRISFAATRDHYMRHFDSPEKGLLDKNPEPFHLI